MWQVLQAAAWHHEVEAGRQAVFASEQTAASTTCGKKMSTVCTKQRRESRARATSSSVPALLPARKARCPSVTALCVVRTS